MTRRDGYRDRARQAIKRADGDRRRQIMDQLTADLADVTKRRGMTRNPSNDGDVYVAALALTMHYEDAFIPDEEAGAGPSGGPAR